MLKKRFLILPFLFFIVISGYSIKFKIKTSDENNPIIIQTIFDTGFSFKGVTDGFGVTDYESVFFRPAFHVNDFGIGFDFDFRFRFFNGQINFLPQFWNAGDPVDNLYLYLDKIDYIVYGDFDKPFFLNIGKNPVTTLGTGFLVKDFHNYAFLPVSKQQGLFFKFNGENLTKIKKENIPVDFTFIIQDLENPDIFIFDAGLDLFQLTKLKNDERFSLRVGQIYATDINATQSNRLSSVVEDDTVVTTQRNLTSGNAFTSVPLFTSLYSDFVWKYDYFRLNAFEEFSFLFDFMDNSQNTSGPISQINTIANSQTTVSSTISQNTSSPYFNFGMGTKQGIEIRVINLKNSGFLLGLLTGLLVQSPFYAIDYFSSNYEVLRQKQYINLSSNTELTPYALLGFALYGLNDRIKFVFNVSIPFVQPFEIRFSSKFIMDKTVVPGLFISVYYETGVNQFLIAGSGGGFINSITDGFRFSAEAGYKFYGAKVSFLLGMQRAGWVQMNQTLINGVIDYDLAQYNSDIQKFVSIEISFIL